MSNTAENRLPGFTAEKSIYQTEDQYVLASSIEGSHTGIEPASARGSIRMDPSLHCYAVYCETETDCEVVEIPCPVYR
jgi:hypothetical protein